MSQKEQESFYQHSENFIRSIMYLQLWSAGAGQFCERYYQNAFC